MYSLPIAFKISTLPVKIPGLFNGDPIPATNCAAGPVQRITQRRIYFIAWIYSLAG